MARLAKPKLVEVTLRVRVPKHWSAARAKHEISESWYGEVHPGAWHEGDSVHTVLYPKWSKARVVRRKGRR